MVRFPGLRLLTPLLAVGLALPAASSPAVPTPTLHLVAATPASAGQWQLLTATNNARAAAHLPALRLSSTLSQNLAAGWARHMAAAGTISHNPNLRAAMDRYAPHWTVIGENVGVGPTIAAVQTALMNSPGHRANILESRYRYVGLGVLSAGGRIWIVEDFAATSDTLTTMARPATPAPHRVGVVNPGAPDTVLTVPGGRGPVTVATYRPGSTAPQVTTSLGGTAVGGVAGATRGTARLVAIRGGNNHVYVRWQRDGVWDSRWTSLGGITTATPAVATTPGGRTAVLVRGGNNRLYVRWFSGGRWDAAWTSLGGILTSGLSATATVNGLRVAVVGGGGAIFTRTFSDRTGWAAHFASLRGITRMAPAAVTEDSGHTVRLFVVGTNGALYVRSLVSGHWDARWRRLGGVLQSAPAATANPATGTATVWGFGAGGRVLYEATLTGQTWSGWTRR